jgi:HIRAN domain
MSKRRGKDSSGIVALLVVGLVYLLYRITAAHWVWVLPAVAVICGLYLFVKVSEAVSTPTRKAGFDDAKTMAAPENCRVFYSKVAGVTHKNPDGTSRQRIIKTCAPGEGLVLVREPENPYDPDAVKVYRSSGEQVGYLSADRLASEISSTMGSGEQVTAEVSQVTGGTKGKPTRGLNIKIIVPR